MRTINLIQDDPPLVTFQISDNYGIAADLAIGTYILRSELEFPDGTITKENVKIKVKRKVGK